MYLVTANTTSLGKTEKKRRWIVSANAILGKDAGQNVTLSKHQSRRPNLRRTTKVSQSSHYRTRVAVGMYPGCNPIRESSLPEMLNIGPPSIRADMALCVLD